jgi:hypothetical protein
MRTAEEVKRELHIEGVVYQQIELALSMNTTQERKLRDDLSDQAVLVQQLMEERDRLEEAEGLGDRLLETAAPSTPPSRWSGVKHFLVFMLMVVLVAGLFAGGWILTGLPR